MDVVSVEAAEFSADLTEEDGDTMLLPLDDVGIQRSSRKILADGAFRPPNPSTNVEVVANMCLSCSREQVHGLAWRSMLLRLINFFNR